MTDDPQTTAITIRRAIEADVPHIVQLLADDPLGSQREMYREPLPPTYYAAFHEITANPHNELIVVEHNGMVIGTLQLTFIPGLSFQGSKRAQIEAVRIARQYRGQQLGTQLFAWAIERARAEGCRFVQLTTNSSRRDAHRFYERLGFVASHVGMKLDLQAQRMPSTEPSEGTFSE